VFCVILNMGAEIIIHTVDVAGWLPIRVLLNHSILFWPMGMRDLSVPS
jgi:hypothetical protein